MLPEASCRSAATAPGDNATTRETRLRWAFRVRGLLMVPPILFTLLCFRGEFEKDWLIYPLGFAVFGLGVGVRVWAQMHLHYRLRVHKVLTRTGPYRFVRNPIYIGNTAILLGLVIMSELLWFLPVMLAYCAVVYHYVVRYEEAHLSEKYGQPYRAYLAAVPRWLPHRSRKAEPSGAVAEFFLSSLWAEVHCLLWVLPFVAKEWVGMQFGM